MMYSIPLPKLELSSQTRTLNKGTAAKIIGNARNLASNITKHHAKQSQTISNDSITDVASAITFAEDIQKASATHELELKAVLNAVALMDGAQVDDTSHPLVEACVHLKNQIEIAKKAGATDLAALDLSETISGLSDLRGALANEAETIENRLSKTLAANRKAFGAAVARCRDVDDIAELLEENDTTWKAMLPPDWNIELPETALGKATFNPAEKLNSPERAASVVLTQIRMALDNDKRRTKQSSKAASARVKQQLADDVVTEIGELLRGE